MSQVRCQITMSLDGYVAGPDQRPDEPLGTGGEELHEWAFATEAWQEHHDRTGGEQSPDSKVVEDDVANIGAYVMGRNMFAGPGDGPWAADWRGWWGEDPPYHAPVFVLTHHAHEPIEMQGGTTFHFVTDGAEAAIEQAKAAAGDKDVMVAGGAQAVQQVLAAGLLDELHLHVVPKLLGGGARLLDDVGTPELEIVETVASPTVTHVRYRVVRSA